MTYSDCREGDGGLVRIGLSCDRQYLFASTREFVLAPGITPFDIYRIGLRRRCIEPVAVNLDELSNHGFRSQFPAHAICLSGQRRSEEHTSELQSRGHLVCRLLLEKKKQQ